MINQTRFVVPCVALALLSGCFGDHSASAQKGRSKLQNSTWLVDSIAGNPVNLSGVHQPPQFTLSGSDKRISAHGGVNRLSGSYVLEMSKLTFGPLAGTKMAGPPELNQQEAEFVKALTATNGFKVEGETLTLLKDWEPLMTLHAGK